MGRDFKVTYTLIFLISREIYFININFISFCSSSKHLKMSATNSICIMFTIVIFCLSQTVDSRPQHPLSSFLTEHIKQKILAEINRNPEAGTEIMPTKEMRKEVCLAKPFNQTINKANCIPKIIENKFCYGQCNSLYIPEVSIAAMATCFTCQPSVTIEEQVVLQCVVNNRLQNKVVSVEKIISCQCNQCH